MSMAGRPKSPTSFPIAYSAADPSPDVSLFDADNPLSVVNMVEEAVAKAIMGIPPRYLKMTETQLRKEVKPDEVLCRLKLSFWDEYQRAQDGKRKIHVTKLIAGTGCTKERFYDVVLRDPEQVAWVVTPPVDHMIQLRELLELGLSRQREMLMLPFVFKETKVDQQGNVKKTRRIDARVMSQINQAVNTLLDRVHGAVMQKVAVQQQSLNVNVNKSVEQAFDTASLEQLEDMEKTLDRLAGKIKEIAPSLSEPETIDIEEITEDGELERVVKEEGT
jgi:hypothetical protein